MNRAIRKYPWPSMVVGETRLFRAHGSRRKFLLRAVLLRSAAYYRRRWKDGFAISTHEVGRGVEARRIS